jgi:hypothetical protein
VTKQRTARVHGMDPQLPRPSRRTDLVTSVLAAAAVGYLVALDSTITAIAAAVLVIGVVMVAVVSPRWTIAFVLVGGWPLLLLGRGKAGPALAAVGVVLWLQLIRNRERQRLTGSWSSHRLGLFVTPIALIGFVAALSFPIEYGSTEATRVILACVLTVPMFWAGGRYANSLPYREIILLGLPLAFAGFFMPTSFVFSNPIVVGNTMWLVAISAVALRSMAPWLRATVVTIAGAGLLSAGKLGPLVAASAVLGVYLLVRPSPGFRVRRTARVFALLAIAAFVVPSIVKTFSAHTSGSIINNTVSQRRAAYQEIVGHPSLLGHGLARIDVSQALNLSQKVPLNYGHNFLLDALYAGGIVGLVLVGFPVLIAARNATRYPTIDICLPIGLIVSALFSGGFENASAWFALGVLIAWRPLSRQRETAALSDAKTTVS